MRKTEQLKTDKMFQVESRIGKIAAQQEDIYRIISDFTNIPKFIPQEKLQGIKAEKEVLTFNLPKTGEMTLGIDKMEPSSLIKYKGNFRDQNFYLYIQLKSPNPGDTRFKLTLRAEMPSVVGWAIKGKMQTMLDELVGRIEKICL